MQPDRAAARAAYEAAVGGDWDSLPPGTRRHWQDVVTGDGAAEVLLTVDEAVQVLDPPISRPKLKALIEATGLPSRGTRRRLGPGRPALTYSAGELMRLHAANIPLMHEFAAASGTS